MATVLVAGGTLVTPEDRFAADIVIEDGTIAAIDADASIDADKTIDAAGQYVLPGLIHPHCHFRDPGLTHKEDFYTGQRAAAAGGYTFTIDQTNTEPPPTDLEAWNEKRERAQELCILDHNHYAAARYPETIAELAETGTVGFKIFNTRHPTDTYPYDNELAVTDRGLLFELYERIAAADLPVAVHHDQSDWVKHVVERDYIEPGKTTAADLHEAYDRGVLYGHGMVMGLAASLHIAELAGVELYVLHAGMMKDGDYELIRAARERGQTVHAELELLPFQVDEDRRAEYGPYAVVSGKDPDRAAKLVNEGWATTMVNEHAPHTPDEIEPGWEDAWHIPLGLMGAQEHLPHVLTWVNEGRFELEDVVRLEARNPAQIFGLYPRKGSLQVGTDADLTIVDMDMTRRFTDDDVESKSGWTLFDGERFDGWPVRSIVRGTTVMADGEIRVDQGYGEFVPRGE
ncbi:MAG: dihydroorotase family protein [Salinirussus sp.]